MILNNAQKSSRESATAELPSYQQVVIDRLHGLPNLQIETLRHLEYGDASYPMLLVRSTPRNSKLPSVLVSGGVHGDEPAGVYAAVEFLIRVLPEFAEAFNFFVLPCVNPSGFEHNRLHTVSGENLNRLFGTNSTQPEVRAIEQWLQREGRRFRVSFDLHEIVGDYQGEGFQEGDNPRACYLYETAPKPLRMGHELIAALPATTEVCRWPTIYKDTNSDGVIYYPEGCQNPVYAEQTTFEAFLFSRYSDHAFTTETPTGWPLKKRVQTQLTWLKRGLELLSSGS